MKNITVLDNNMFDDGSFECFNFWLADKNDVLQVSSTCIEALGLKQQVLEAMKQGKSYLSVSIQYDGSTILEIQWG